MVKVWYRELWRISCEQLKERDDMIDEREREMEVLKAQTSQPAEAGHREIRSVCDSYVSYICHGLTQHTSNSSGTPCPCHSYREGGRPYVRTDCLDSELMTQSCNVSCAQTHAQL